MFGDWYARNMYIEGTPQYEYHLRHYGHPSKFGYTVFHDFDVLARSMVIRNESDQPMTLTEVQTSVPLPMDDYEIIHLKGAWARERFAQRIPMPQGTFSISSRRGASSHENNPFLALVKPHTTEHGGDVYAMTHVYSGSFSASVDVGIDAAPRMMMGSCSDVFSWQLEPGAAFQAPETLLTYAHDGLNGLSHRMHAFIRQRICRGMWRDQPRPILINNWEATYFDFTSDKLVEIARRGAEIGCELFVIDDGWFGNPQPWHVKLTDLDDTAVYVDEAHGLRCSGGALMNIGIPVPRAWQDHESWIYCFEKA